MSRAGKRLANIALAALDDTVQRIREQAYNGRKGVDQEDALLACVVLRARDELARGLKHQEKKKKETTR